VLLKIREEIKKLPESNKMKTQCTEPMEYSKGHVNGKLVAASTYIKNTE
jgi:hypothetical protein